MNTILLTNMQTCSSFWNIYELTFMTINSIELWNINSGGFSTMLYASSYLYVRYYLLTWELYFKTSERMFVCPRSIYRKDINQAAFLDNLVYKVRCICSIVHISLPLTHFKLATPTILGPSGIYQIPFIRELLDPFWTLFDLPIAIEFKEVFHPYACEPSNVSDTFLRWVS